MKNKKGLTLIELLAVIAIIAILFILLVPQVTKATDKARVSGVQVDLHSYEVGMRAYFMEHFGEAKTVEGLNKYLDKALKFEEVDGKFVSKVEENPYKVKYVLTSDWQTYMQVNSYTDEKDPRLHAVRVYEEGNEVKSIYIGFDDEKRLSEVDNEAPIISIDPNGGEDIENVFVEVTDNNEVFNIQFMWSTEKVVKEYKWQTVANNTQISSVFLGKGIYYLHIQASDLDMNVERKTSEPYILGDVENPVINITVNGSEEEKLKHTTIVNVTDNKQVCEIKYTWSESETKPTAGWIALTNGATVSTPDEAGALYLHVEAYDCSGNKDEFVSKPFNIGDSIPPEIALSLNGSTTTKPSHSTTVSVTDNDQVRIVNYAWSESTVKNITKWTEVANNTAIKTPKKNGSFYLHIEAKDRSGNKAYYISEVFAVEDPNPPVITLSPNGVNQRATTHKTTLKVTDNEGVKEVKYVWSEDTTFPEEGWKTTAATVTLTSPQTFGNVYLYVIAEDDFGNVTKFKSDQFVQGVFAFKQVTGGVAIQIYYGNAKEIDFPDTLGGQPIVSFTTAQGVFNYYEKLTRITLPKHLKTIEDFTFRNNNLTELTIPNEVVTIGSNAFYGNNIVNLTLPNSLRTIKVEAFANNKITKLVIPEGVTTVGNYAFEYNKITEIRLPSTLTSVGSNTFQGNTNLQKIVNCSNLSLTNALKTSTGTPAFKYTIEITKEGC